MAATLISKKIVKPCPATQESLQIHNLSSMDQACPCDYFPLAFFYPSVCGTFGSRSQISQHIEDSLSKTLAYYYPFAGRLVGNHQVSCNDAGVELREVQINRPMSEILLDTHSFADDVVFPTGLPWNGIENAEDNLLVIQLNYFDCGGLAIAICLSHRIGDALTIASFMNDLATSCRQSDYTPSPQFTANTIFPPEDDPVSFSSSSSTNNTGVARRYVFRPADLEKLKAMATESGIEKPTRVEVVTALIIRRALAASIDDSATVRPFTLIQPTNVRPLIPLQQNSVGCLAPNNMFAIEDKRVSFPEFVSQLRNAKVKFQNVYKQKLFSKAPLQDTVREMEKLISDGSYDFYLCSSLCGFPLYGIDFGWGKPTRVCLSQFLGKGVLYLIDTPDNGVEAMLNLDEQVMSILEHDKDLLSFTSLHQGESVPAENMP